MDTDNERKRREVAFHDRKYASSAPRPTTKYYLVTGSSLAAFRAQAIERSAGLDVLECGCGPGHVTLELAASGAKTTAIDLSHVAVEETRRLVEAAGESGVEARVMDAEAMTFADESFDLVCGTGVLHHLDLTRAYPEIARVLRPSGKAVFREPLAANPLINLYRRLTPGQRTQDEHPLQHADLVLASTFFEQVRVTRFHLTVIAAAPLVRYRRIVTPTAKALDALDRMLLRIPVLRNWSWMAVIVLAQPRLNRHGD